MATNVTDAIQPGVFSNLRSVTRYLVDREVELAGWGEREDGLRPMVMQTATTKIMDSIECLNRINRLGGQRLNFAFTYFCTIADPYILMTRVSVILYFKVHKLFVQYNFSFDKIHIIS